MSRKIENAHSRATFFRHSAVLSLPAVLLRKLANVTGCRDKLIHKFIRTCTLNFDLNDMAEKHVIRSIAARPSEDYVGKYNG